MKRWLLRRDGIRQRYNFRGDPKGRRYRWNQFAKAWAKRAGAPPGEHGNVEVSVVLGGSKKSPGYARMTFIASPREAARIRRENLPRGVRWMKLRGVEVRTTDAKERRVVSVDVSTRGRRRTKLEDEVEGSVKGQLRVQRRAKEAKEPDVYGEYWEDWSDADDHDTP